MIAAATTLPERIAEHIDATTRQVDAAITMLDGGDTVPFISRYRKEATGGLTDAQLRQLDERLHYLRELDERRASIAKAIDEQGKLDDALTSRLIGATTKAELEDLYLPYKKKRRTRGQMAIEAGLEPLATLLWNEPAHDPEIEAQRFVSAGAEGDAGEGVADVKAALDGARFILMERFAEDATLIARLRRKLTDEGYLCARLVAGKADEGAKFSDYFDHQEPLSRVPGHRALAMFRGRGEGVLALNLLLKQGDDYNEDGCISLVAAHVGFDDAARPADAWRARVVSWTWSVKLCAHLESELFTTLRERADAEAIGVFAANLKDLLLAAPAGPRPVLGLDPGYRSGVKVCVVDASGRVCDHTAIFPHVPRKQWRESLDTLAVLCNRHAVELIAVGNGTASRETEKLADELVARIGPQRLTRVVVSEAGASVYSASEVAEREFPDLDVTIRGAVSIARRLQDPLAELVKIDARAIGVGQYQHDVSQRALAQSLEATVEDCVNAVGVDLGTASTALLSRVAGLSSALAENIVEYRDLHGGFKRRKELLKVPRLGPRAFEQAAGFLRIPQGADPLDASGVHPESYPVVERIVARAGKPLGAVIGDTGWLRTLDAVAFTDEQFGLPTVMDIIAELEKPGRDPRPAFRAVRFTEGVEKIGDLTLDQVLEGKITNVTAFGAFVDIGVHQDGLVHISAMSETFVRDPREVVKAGDIVSVKVMAIDEPRQRIGLSMRMSDHAADRADGSGNVSGRASRRNAGGRRDGAAGSSEREGRGRSGTDGRRGGPMGKRSEKGGGGSSRSTQTSAESPSALALSLQEALKGKP